jgi:hypothetical protein
MENSTALGSADTESASPYHTIVLADFIYDPSEHPPHAKVPVLGSTRHIP